MYARAVLGQIDDATADDFGLDAPSTPRDDYVAWALAVKQAGGTVATMPHVNKGAAAARYPVDTIFPPPDYTLSPLFHRPPDDWSDDSGYGYYRAPAAVLAYFMGGTSAPGNQAQAVPGEPAPPMPAWYDSIYAALKFGGWIVGGLLAIELMNHLPRARD